MQEVTETGQWLVHVPPQASMVAIEEYEALMAELQQIPVQLSGNLRDEPRWKWAKDGKYTVKTFYVMYEEGPHVISSISKFWKIKAPMRVMVFGWLMLHNKILTVDNLVKRGWELVNRCCLCREQAETVKHLFRNCRYTQEVRLELSRRIPYLTHCQLFVQGSYWRTLLYSTDKRVKQLQIVLIFAVWKERCRRVFQEKEKTENQLTSAIIEENNLWFNISNEAHTAGE